jgi:hypothetical protein
MNKKIRLEIRLSEDDANVFRKKAKSYGDNMSAMVREAVYLFDDQRSKGSLETMDTLLLFYKKYQQQLSWLGGNFNQCMHRANELALAGELSSDYFTSVLLPKTKEAISIIRSIKDELDKIHDHIEDHL